jgi:hypothetical protein
MLHLVGVLADIPRRNARAVAASAVAPTAAAGVDGVQHEARRASRPPLAAIKTNRKMQVKWQGASDKFKQRRCAAKGSGSSRCMLGQHGKAKASLSARAAARAEMAAVVASRG